MSREFLKKYDPSIEQEVYKRWENYELFSPEWTKNYKDIGDEKFVITMPPPNVTGVLHLGHALMLAIEDAMVRYARMSWKETVWIPGTDHAWIATQAVVEKKLKNEGVNKYSLWRDKFVDKVWEWSKASKDTITSQIMKMWASCDWSREHFTLSESLSRAVRKSFVNLYQKWKIYKWDYIVNWCPKSQTVISDIEVDYKEEQTKLYYIRYFVEGKWDSIPVATIRPETIFGDVAVAVNPKDRRYKKFIWKNVLIPIVNRPIPVIADEYVDVTFGTWALKITPTHDPNDYEIWKKHNLPMDKFSIDKDGYFTSLAWEFEWYPREDVMENLEQTLDEIWNIEKIEKYNTKIPYSDRYDTKIQPMLSSQWFVDVEEAARKSMEYVDEEKIKIYPQKFKKIFYNWLEECKPWCISRQQRRGHRIPVWYCENNHKNVFDEDTVFLSSNNSVDDETLKSRILSMMIFNLIADERLPNPFNIEELVNVLFEDTLEKTNQKVYEVYIKAYKLKFAWRDEIVNYLEELERYFKQIANKEDQILKEWDKIVDMVENSEKIKHYQDMYHFQLECKECSSTNLTWEEDVLDTWFSSALWPFSTLWWPEKTYDFQNYFPNTVLETGYDIIFFRVARMIMMSEENLGSIPFENIYLHWLVKRENGEKMSKSKWNIIDPIDVIDRYWADTLRLSLLLGNTPGNDIRFWYNKLDYNSRFLNKLWNASRFIFTKVLESNNEISIDYSLIKEDIYNNQSKLNDFDVWIVNRLDHLTASSSKYMDKFMIGELGQEIIDVVWHDFCDWYIEISKVSPGEMSSKVLLYWIWTILKFLHPFAPFVTEKLWNLLGFEGFLMVSDFPWPMNISEKNIKIQILMDMISEFRNLRHHINIKPHEKVESMVATNSVMKEFIQTYEDVVKTLWNIEKIQYIWEQDNPEQDFVTTVVSDITIWVKAIKEVDEGQIIKQLEKQLEDEKEFLQSLRNILASPWFQEKAPEDVVQEKKDKIEEVKKKIDNLEYEINKKKMNNK